MHAALVRMVYEDKAVLLRSSFYPDLESAMRYSISHLGVIAIEEIGGKGIVWLRNPRRSALRVRMRRMATPKIKTFAEFLAGIARETNESVAATIIYERVK